MKKFLKNCSALSVLILLALPAFGLALVNQVKAQDDLDPEYYFDISDDEQLGDVVKLGERDPRAIAANTINVLLSFLGIVAVVIILAGGFMWMTASGNEDNLAQAKRILSGGLIGLVIVLASYGIAFYLVRNLVVATS